MTQSELNRAVARATGETVSEIGARGFVPLTPVPFEREPHPNDWEQPGESSDAVPRNLYRVPR